MSHVDVGSQAKENGLPHIANSQTSLPNDAKLATPALGDGKMDDLVLIEGEKSALFEHLNTNFPVSSLSLVAALAPTFCRVLCEQLRDRLLTRASRVFPGSVSDSRQRGTIEFDGRVFKIQFTTEPLTERDKLPFVILEHGGDEPLPSSTAEPKLIPLTSIAQYKSIEFSIDQKLPVDEAFLDSFVRGIFSAGYQWLSNKLTSAIRSDTAKISTALYDYMRSMLAENLGLLDGFLLSCLLDKKDFVILDEIATEGALRLADQRAVRYQKPREAIVLQVIGEIVNIDDSVITDACEADTEIMRVPLTSESKYYRENEEFFDSMAAVWGKEVTCHPVVRSGRLRVVAFYPSSVAYELTPLLSVHVETLARMATEQADRIREHLNVLEKVFSPPPQAMPDTQGRWIGLAELIGVVGGTFSGRFVKNVSE